MAYGVLDLTLEYLGTREGKPGQVLADVVVQSGDMLHDSQQPTPTPTPMIVSAVAEGDACVGACGVRRATQPGEFDQQDEHTQTPYPRHYFAHCLAKVSYSGSLQSPPARLTNQGAPTPAAPSAHTLTSVQGGRAHSSRQFSITSTVTIISDTSIAQPSRPCIYNAPSPSPHPSPPS
ncbi:uncharacterized protein MYCFIDRAFT_173313 [Pseudocercospora fijiensis CIRAD86]|uniref:Uncharacterized protein n=1 Tax=Pseudocercospora fijiensis (strain CIRAD86) TaxID=383855 RepID=M2Z399_PSEFD|nr:uncharacterized protein MYCFIDRAFT_173313 [Pseudocercospora fijiensis CIRAD86]EME84295.1 hypothetical protein MYCFIDRAFT_173313 [Pseudocercospora fijiensis CIRAD86]